MEIPNLSQTIPSAVNGFPASKNHLFILIVAIVLGLTTGFWISRFNPSDGSLLDGAPSAGNEKSVSLDNIKSSQELKSGVLYGNQAQNFKDHATGVIEKGSINGEGTHILVREGGPSQRASLTSSVVDLDFFVGKKVEVSGETNASNKTSWLMDVGTVKIIE